MAAKKAADARKAEMKNESEIQKRRNVDEDFFNRQYYQDMTNRSEVQNMLRTLREQQAERRNANEAKAAVMGETAEQQIAKQDSLNKSYADSIAEMANNASTLKDSYLKDYQGNLHTYYDERKNMNSKISDIESNASDQWSTAANNAFATAGTFAGIAAGAAGNNTATNTASTPEPSTAERIAKAPSRSAQFSIAADAATSPLEKTVYQDLSKVAAQAAVTQPQTPRQDTVPQGAPYKPLSPWEIGWTK